MWIFILTVLHLHLFVHIHLRHPEHIMVQTANIADVIGERCSAESHLAFCSWLQFTTPLCSAPFLVRSLSAIDTSERLKNCGLLQWCRNTTTSKTLATQIEMEANTAPNDGLGYEFLLSSFITSKYLYRPNSILQQHYFHLGQNKYLQNRQTPFKISFILTTLNFNPNSISPRKSTKKSNTLGQKVFRQRSAAEFECMGVVILWVARIQIATQTRRVLRPPRWFV